MNSDLPVELFPGAISDGYLYDGQWQQSEHSMAAVEPATGLRLARVGLADPQRIAASARAARQAQPGWAALAYDDRARILRHAARLAEHYGAELRR